MMSHRGRLETAGLLLLAHHWPLKKASLKRYNVLSPSSVALRGGWVKYFSGGRQPGGPEFKSSAHRSRWYK